MKSAIAAVLLLLPMRIFAGDLVGLVYIDGATTFSYPTPASLVGIYLVDAQGRRTGADPSRPPTVNPKTGMWQHTCCFVGEIPNLDASTERLDPDDNSGDYGNEAFKISGQLPAGVYNLVVFSTVSYSVPYYVDFRPDDAAGKMNVTVFHSFLLQNTTATFTFNYDPTPGRVPTVAKILSFPILRQELRAAFQLGDIGGKKFVDELDGVLAQGEKALARTNRDTDNHHGDGDAAHGKREAVAKLREFVKRIESAAKVKPGDVGRGRDRDDDDRRFATATAAQSLTADADALIVQLGGKISRGRDDHGEGRH